MANPVILVVGAGPGVGAAVARRFGRDGYDVALIARSPGRLEELGTQLQSEGITTGWTAADITDGPEVSAAITHFGGFSGHLDVVHFNPSAFTQKSPLELTPSELLRDLHVGVASLLSVVQAARPFMSEGARITATGSMSADHPWSQGISLGIQKAGLRNLVTGIDSALKGDGIRAMSLTVQGTISDTGDFTPERIADALYAASRTPTEDWATEVAFPG